MLVILQNIFDNFVHKKGKKMNFPNDLKYTQDHEWIRVEGNIGIVGVTDYAQGELGDIVYIDINDNLGDISAGASVGTIEAVKTVSDMFAPVSGKIIEINTSLNDAPETVNKDPYGEGWILKIEMSNTAELDNLLDASAYQSTLNH